MPKRSQRDHSASDTSYRSLSVRAATFSEESRSVEAVISTDQPVLMPDWNRMEMVPEVLVPSGAEYPSNRQQTNKLKIWKKVTAQNSRIQAFRHH